MKASIFNVFRPRGRETIIFNTLTGKARVFDAETAARIEAGEIDGLDEAAERKARAIQAIVSEELDELVRFRSLYQAALHDRRALSVICILTYRCNLRCPYCFEEGVHGARAARMSDEQLGLVIEALERKCARDGSRALSVMLFGGEPLLEVDKGQRLLSELSEWCAQHGVAFTGSMSSNGTLLAPKRLAQLAPHLRVVQIALDGPQSIHDEIRVGANKKPTYEETIRGIQRLLMHKINVHVRIQVSQANREHIPELLQDLHARGLVGHPLIRYSLSLIADYASCNRCDTGNLSIDPDSELGREVMTISPSLLPKTTPVTQILPCIMTPNAFAIDPSGELFKCITAVGQPDRCVGAIDREGELVFNDHYYQYVARDPTKLDDCRSCNLLPLCGGGCPTSAYEESGSYERSWCGNSRSVLSSRIDNAVGLGGGTD